MDGREQVLTVCLRVSKENGGLLRLLLFNVFALGPSSAVRSHVYLSVLLFCYGYSHFNIYAQFSFF